MQAKLPSFSQYQIMVIVLLAITVFTVVLDFMVLSPLGAQLLRIMEITPKQFGLVVSAYAFSAGISGILTAGFADRFDRKKMLLFFYSGFILGTLFCALANTYQTLLFARIFTGLFGGVISSISFAIITDLFAPEQRGRVMGFVQTSFAASQVLGVPVGLYLAHRFDWHAPFMAIVALALVMFVVVALVLKPVNQHLQLKSDHNALRHLLKIVSNKYYLRGFLAMALLSIGGFLLMPFSSPFLVNNIGVSEAELPLIFMCTGACTLLAGPLVGKFSDLYGKFQVFLIGTVLTTIMVWYYTNMSPSPISWVIVINCLLFIGVSARIISGSALMTMIPDAADRGAYMGINSSLQQIAGGVGSMMAGLIVVQSSNKTLQHFDTLGYITIVLLLACLYFMYVVKKIVDQKVNGKI